MASGSQIADVNIRVRPWVKQQLELFIGPKRRTYDAIITWLISEHQRTEGVFAKQEEARKAVQKEQPRQ